MIKIVFFFPWKELSGGPFYLGRLANDIADKGIYDVYYTDYPHGLANDILKNRNIKILKYKDEGSKFVIFPDEPIILVLPVYWLYMVPKIHPDSKIVLFNWHNECIPALKTLLHCTNEHIKKYLNLMWKTDSVFFLDKTHWLAQNTSEITFREKYVPIVIPKREKKVDHNLISTKQRTIAILGRLSRDKVYAVLDLLDNITDIRDGIKTKVYIIGDGDCKHLLNDNYPSWIEIVKCGTMEYDVLLDFLSNKIDILFAMGTSVLDGASLGLPAVVIPNDVKPFECNQYAFLYECNGYVVGWGPNQIKDLDIPMHTIADIFEQIYTFNGKKEIGIKCYDYYLKNHTSNLHNFLTAVNDSQLTKKVFDDFRKDNFNLKLFLWKVRELFRRYRGEILKQYSIMGIPIITYTKTIPEHRNIFVLCIPLLRLNWMPNSISVHLLPLVWLFRSVVHIIKPKKRFDSV